MALLLSLLVSAKADEVVFTKHGLVAVPASYGYLVFALKESDVRDLYSNRAQTVLDSYSRYLASKTSLNLCVSLGHAESCKLSVNTANETALGQYGRELEAIVASVNSTVDDIVGVAFSDSDSNGNGARPKRQVLGLINAAGGLLNLGLNLKNAHDVRELRSHLRRNNERLDALVLAVDGISRTQLRDHEMVSKVIRQVARRVSLIVFCTKMSLT